MADIKWSAFTNVGALQNGDVIVGLRSGNNVQFNASQSIINWVVNSNATINAVANNGYILTSASATTLTLPASLVVGAFYGVAGHGAAWTVNLSTNSLTVTAFGNTYSNSFASTNNTDVLVLLATTTNNLSIVSMTSTGLTAS